MAEVITDAIAHKMGRRARGGTRAFALDGAPRGNWVEFQDTEMHRLRTEYGLNQNAARHLLHRYGRRAADVAAYLDDDPGLAKPIVPDEPDLQVEFVYQRDHEMAIYSADYFLRRTRLGLFHPHLLQTPLVHGVIDGNSNIGQGLAEQAVRERVS